MLHSKNYPLNPQYHHVTSYYTLLMIARCALKDDICTCGIKKIKTRHQTLHLLAQSNDLDLLIKRTPACVYIVKNTLKTNQYNYRDH